MGRGLLAMLALACLVLALFTLTHHDETPPMVSLRSVHFQTEQYEGRRVQVTGTVRVFQDTGAPYYVLEDDQQNRILLRADPGQLGYRVGERIIAVGVVGFDESQGIYLKVESVTAPR